MAKDDTRNVNNRMKKKTAKKDSLNLPPTQDKEAAEAGLRAVVEIADELILCPDLDSVFRTAVERAREKLKIERCGIFFARGNQFYGTYGTDRKGQTTDEHFHSFPIREEWVERFMSTSPQDRRMISLEQPYHEIKDGKVTTFGAGWAAFTPITSATKLLGAFCNDSAITQAPMDSTRQEIISVFCSLLGSIIEGKRTEERRQNLLEGLGQIVAITDELICCPDIDTFYRRAVELARERLGVERCALFLRDGNKLRGTYGTNSKRTTTCEYEHLFQAYPNWITHFETLDASERQMVLHEEPYTEWKNKKAVRFDKGWVAITPIQSATELIGVFSNDTAISRKPVDPAQQEIITVYSSLLGALIERRRTEEALRESERRFRETLSTISLIAITLDTKGHILFCNDYFIKLSGWDAEKLIGSNWFDVMIPPEIRKEIRARFLDHVHTGSFPVHYENDILTHDGKLRTISWTNTALRDTEGHFIGITSIGEDITERKQTEARFQRLAMVVEQEAEAVIISNTSGAIQYVNPAFEKITGYRREEVIGKNPRLLKSGRQDKDYYQKMWKSLANGEPWEGHFTNCRKDGSTYELETTISPIRDDQNKIVSYVATSRDITHEMQLEQQFRQSQKMEAIGRLAGGIAHDFNNLLTSILGYSHLVEDEINEGNPIRKDIDEIIHAGERAAALTKQLLTFSRKQSIQLRSINLNSIVMDVDKLLRRTLGENIELVSLLDSEMGYANVDVGLMEQILMNLAINARDAMPRGGTLTLCTKTVDLNEPFIRRHVGMEPGKYVLLSVKDTGKGMSKDVYEHCFEPFFTTKERGKGTGLGLSIVYSAARQFGGFLDVNSIPGDGSTFTIYLPCVPASDEKAVFQKKKTLPRGTETILLVEDEESVRRLSVRLLESLGYKVLEARHGGEAILICERHKENIDMILTDVVMPHIGGQELVIRLQEVRQDFRVLYMSGFTDDSFLPKDAEGKQVELLSKPFTNEQLAVRIREVLDTN